MRSPYPKDEYVHYVDEWSIKPEQFTADQKSFLLKLNAQLVGIEKEIDKEVVRLRKECEKKLNDPNDWVEDYEIECCITFILKEDDPYFSEDDDNILVEIWKSGKRKSVHGTRIWWIADNNNHNKFQNRDHPLKDEHHCWLYYWLYAHTELGWANIFRIGAIWLDVNVEYQKILKVPS